MTLERVRGIESPLPYRNAPSRHFDLCGHLALRVDSHDLPPSPDCDPQAPLYILSMAVDRTDTFRHLEKRTSVGYGACNGVEVVREDGTARRVGKVEDSIVEAPAHPVWNCDGFQHPMKSLVWVQSEKCS